MEIPVLDNLADKILNILKQEGRPLQGREIIDALSSGDPAEGGVDRNEVFQCLIGPQLTNLIAQDNRFRWSLTSTDPDQRRRNGAWIRFDDLIDYDLAARAHHVGTEVQVPIGDDRIVSIMDRMEIGEEVRATIGPAMIARLSDLGQVPVLVLGQGLFVTAHPDRRLIPVLIRQLDFTLEGDTLEIRSAGRVTVNPAWKRIRGIEGHLHAAAEESTPDLLQRALTLDFAPFAAESLDDQPGRPRPALDVISEGLTRRSIVVVQPREIVHDPVSIELKELQGLSDAELESTALAPLFGGAAKIEPRPRPAPRLLLDDDQSEAMFLALEAPLTVVAGAHGTGRTRLAMAAAAAALDQGRTVLMVASQPQVLADELLEIGQTPAIQGGDLGLAEDSEVSGDGELLGFLQEQIETDQAQLQRLIATRNTLASVAATVAEAGRSAADLEALATLGAPPAAELAEAVELLGEFEKTGIGRRLLSRFRKSPRLEEILEQIEPWSTAAGGRPAEGPDGDSAGEWHHHLEDVGRLIRTVEALGQRDAVATELLTQPPFEAFSRSLIEDREELVEEAASRPGHPAPDLGELVTSEDFWTSADEEPFGDRRPLWIGRVGDVIGSMPLRPGLFDLVIVDDAEQIDPASALPLLCRGRSALILGDLDGPRPRTATTAEDDRILRREFGLLEPGDEDLGFVDGSFLHLAAGQVGASHVHHLHVQHRCHVAIHAAAGLPGEVGTLHSELPDAEDATQWIAVSEPVSRSSLGGTDSRAECSVAVDHAERLLEGDARVAIVSLFPGQRHWIELEVESRGLEIPSCCPPEVADAELDALVISLAIDATMDEVARRVLMAVDSGRLLSRARANLVVVGNPIVARGSSVPWLANLAHAIQQGPTLGSGRPLTPPEIALAEILREDGLQVSTGLVPFGVPVDIAITTEDHLIAVQIDGDLLHTPWSRLRTLGTIRRDRQLLDLGWTVRHFWIHQVATNPGACRQAILELIGE